MSESTPIPTAQSVRLGWWLSSEEHDPRALVAHAVAAEEAGISTAMISDHLRPWVPSQAGAPHVWTVIGALSHATEALEVGTGVTALVHRNSPIAIAHAAATAAVMLEGRFFLGVGTGERLNEQPFGERWPSAGERRDQLREAVEVLRALWDDDNTTHRGEWWTVENLRLATRPAAPPPIYVGSSGKKSAAIAGEIGDGLIGVTPNAEVVEIFRGAGGAKKRCLGQLHVCVAASIDEAKDVAWEWWPHGVVPPALLTEVATPKQFEAMADAIGPDSLSDVVVYATDAAPVIHAIDRFVGAGFDTVYLHQVGPDQDRLLEMCSSELLPHYASGAG